MKATITSKGLFIPRELLGNAKRVEIRKENTKIIVLPLGDTELLKKLGKDPVKTGLTDASEELDAYLYGGKK